MPRDSKQKTLFQSWKCKTKDNEPRQNSPSDLKIKNQINKKKNQPSSSKQNDVIEISSTEMDDDDLLCATIALEGDCSSDNIGKNTNDPVEHITGFDNFAGKLWIYPTNYPIRAYQQKIVKTAIFNNTLVALPTGLGKTFIAAVVMYNFYRWYPQGKIVFMAPTKPLVAQQIDACYNIMGIPMEDQIQMTGSTMASNRRQELWNNKRVFFLTPQVINNDLAKGVCCANSIKCLVIDEAHKALGNHAYCQVVQQIIGYSKDFRILALSATPGTDIRTVQQVIKNLLISNIEIRSEDSIDIKQYTHARVINKIVVKLNDQINKIKEKYFKVIEVFIGNLVRCKALYNPDIQYLSKYRLLMARDQYRKDPPTGLSRQVMGIIEGDFAMSVSLYHGLELLLQHGMKSFFIFLKGIMDGNKGNMRARSILSNNADFRSIYDELILLFGASPSSSVLLTQANENKRSSIKLEKKSDQLNYVYSHPKIKELEKIVLKHFQDWKNDAAKDSMNTRVMVFCQYRDSVSEITELLQTHRPLLKPMQFVGHAPTTTPNKKDANSKATPNRRFTQKDQLMVVEKFRSGGYNILVSTCVGEEGLDIGDVDLIVCFDSHKSPIRLVQRMGRTGRKREGRIVMLVTEGKEERDYNSSVASKKTIHKAITGNAGKSLQYYPHNPRMVPIGLNPTCHQMFITVAPQTKKQEKNKKTLKSEKKLGINLDVSVMLKQGCAKTSLTTSQLNLYKEKYQYVGTVKTLPQSGRFISLNKKNKVESTDTSSELSLSEWLPWQCRPQNSTFGHSYSSTMLTEILQMSNSELNQEDDFSFKDTTNNVNKNTSTKKSNIFPDNKTVDNSTAIKNQATVQDVNTDNEVIEISDDIDMEISLPTEHSLPQNASYNKEVNNAEFRNENQDFGDSLPFSLSEDLSPLFPTSQYTDSSENSSEQNTVDDMPPILCDTFNFMDDLEVKTKNPICFKLFDSDSDTELDEKPNKTTLNRTTKTVFPEQKEAGEQISTLKTEIITCKPFDTEIKDKHTNITTVKKEVKQENINSFKVSNNDEGCSFNNTYLKTGVKLKKEFNILQKQPNCLVKKRGLSFAKVETTISFDASADMFGGQFDLDFDIDSQPFTQAFGKNKTNMSFGEQAESCKTLNVVHDNMSIEEKSLKKIPFCQYKSDLPNSEISMDISEKSTAFNQVELDCSEQKNITKNTTTTSKKSLKVNLTQVNRLENRALFADLSSNSMCDDIPCAAVKPLTFFDENVTNQSNNSLKRKHGMPIKCDSPELYFGDDSDFEEFLIEPKKKKVKENTDEEFYPSTPVEFLRKKKRIPIIESDTSCCSDVDPSTNNFNNSVLTPLKDFKSNEKLENFLKMKDLQKHAKHSTPKTEIANNNNKTTKPVSKKKKRICSFIDDEAELSGDDTSFDDITSDDVMDEEMLNFFNDASQLTQHVDGDETRPDEQAMYLKSVAASKFQPSDVENFKGKYKLAYNRGRDIDVFSQEEVDLNESYENDSFCVDDNVVETSHELGEITLLEPCTQIMATTKATTRAQAKQTLNQPKPTKSKVGNKKVKSGRRRLIICDDNSDESFLQNSPTKQPSISKPLKINNMEDTSNVQTTKKFVKNQNPSNYQFSNSENSWKCLECSFVNSDHFNTCQSCNKLHRKVSSSERYCELCGSVLTSKGWMCKSCVMVLKKSEESNEPHENQDLTKETLDLDSSRSNRLKQSLRKQLEFKKKRLSNSSNYLKFSPSHSPLHLEAKILSFSPSPNRNSKVISNAKHTKNMSNSQLSIIVDSRELTIGANQIVQTLRTKLKVNVVVTSLKHNGFILGHRIAAIRKFVSDLTSTNNKTNLINIIHKVQKYFVKVFLIIEKDRVKKGMFGNEKATVSQMSNFRSMVLGLAQENVNLLYSNNQNQTADLLYNLAKRDQQKLEIDSKFLHQRDNLETAARLAVFENFPGVSYLSALYLAQVFKSISSITLSSAEKIEEKCKVTSSLAKIIYEFVRKTFDEQITAI